MHIAITSSVPTKHIGISNDLHAYFKQRVCHHPYCISNHRLAIEIGWWQAIPIPKDNGFMSFLLLYDVQLKMRWVCVGVSPLRLHWRRFFLPYYITQRYIVPSLSNQVIKLTLTILVHLTLLFVDVRGVSHFDSTLMLTYKPINLITSWSLHQFHSFKGFKISQFKIYHS